MSRFYFNVTKDGEPMTDREGDELEDVHAARSSAVEMVQELAREFGPLEAERADLEVEVCDAGHQPLIRVSLHIEARELVPSVASPAS